MPIEIRELVIKVKVEASKASQSNTVDMETLKATVERLCEKEVKRQLQKFKER
jgi:hypothetical protein